MITWAEFWAITKARPWWALFFLALGGLIGCIAEAETHKRCASSDVRGYLFTVCEE